MADIESNINLDINTSSALANLRLLQREISQFQQVMSKTGAISSSKLADMQQNLINGINSTGKFTATLQRVTTTTESFTNSLEKNKFSMGEYFRYAAGSTQAFGKLFRTEFDTIEKVARERVKTLQTQYIKLGRDANGAMKAIAVRPQVLDMEDLGTKTAIAAQKQQLFNQLMKQGSTDLLNFGKNTQWAGRQLMVGFTIPLGIMGAVAAREFKAIEEQVIRLERVYGDFTTTMADTEKITQQVKDLASEFTKYGVAVSKTLGLAADAAAMGKTGADLLAQVSEANRLAVLGGVQQEQSLETTISMTNAFGVAADKLAGKIDFLNAVENQTVTSIEDMTEAIPKAGPVVQQLGGSIEDLTFFMTAMKEGGIDASEGANALKSGLASLINPTGEAVEMLNNFGINIEAIRDKNAGNVTGMVMEFAHALETLDPLQKAQAIETMFGKFQFARMSTLFQNVIAEGTQASRVLDLTKQSAAELAVLSQRELARVEASPLYQFQGAIEDFKAALAPMGETFMQVVTPIIKFGTDLLNKFNEMDSGAKQFVVTLVGAVAGIGPILLMTFGLIANGVANLIKGFMLVKNIFTGTGTASNVLAEQTQYMTTQQLEAAAVASSLGQVHTNLIQTFNSEAAAVRALAGAYSQAIAAQAQFGGPVVTGGKKPRKMARGGIVGGTGNRDSELALLMPGEYVIPKKQSKEFAPLLNQILSGKIPGYSGGRSGQSTGTQKSHMWDLDLNDPAVKARLKELGWKPGSKLKPLGNLTADLPTWMNQAMKEGGGGISPDTFARGWNSVNNKMLASAQDAAKAAGLEMSEKTLSGIVSGLEKNIGARAAQLARASKDGIVTDAILASATKEVLTQAAEGGGRNSALAQALIARGNTVAEFRGNFGGNSDKQLREMIKSGKAEFRGRSIFETSTGIRLGRINWSDDKSAGGKRAQQQAEFERWQKSGADPSKLPTSFSLRDNSTTVSTPGQKNYTNLPVMGTFVAEEKAAQEGTKVRKQRTKVEKKAIQTEEQSIKDAKEKKKDLRRDYALNAAGKYYDPNTGKLLSAKEVERRKYNEARRARYAERKQAAAAATPTSAPGSRMGMLGGKLGVIGMAGGAALGGLSMMGGPVGAVAGNLAGPLMAVGGIVQALQMIPGVMTAMTGPVGLVVAGVAALGIGLYSMHQQLQETRQKAREAAAAVSVGNDAMQKFAEATGKVTATEQLRQRKTNAIAPTEDPQNEFGTAYLESEAGKAMKSGMKSAIESMGTSEAAKKFGLQLGTAVASNLLTADEATQIAAVLGEQLGNENITIGLIGELESLIGPNGEDIKSSPIDVKVKLISETSKSAMGSLQDIADTGFAMWGSDDWNDMVEAEQRAGMELASMREQSQLLIDDLQLQHEARLENLKAAGDLAGIEKENETYAEDRKNLEEEARNGTRKWLKEFKNLSIENQRAIAASAAKSVEETYAGTDSEKAAKDALKALESKRTVTSAKGGSVTKDVFDNETKMILTTDIQAGNISPEQFVELTKFMDPKENASAYTKLATISTELGGPAAGVMASILPQLGDADTAKKIIASIDTENPEEATKLVNTYEKLQQLAGQGGIDLIVRSATDPTAADTIDRLGESYSAIDQLVSSGGPITFEAITNLDLPGFNQLVGMEEYFAGLDPLSTKTFLNKYVTMFETVNDKDVSAWYNKNFGGPGGSTLLARDKAGRKAPTMAEMRAAYAKWAGQNAVTAFQAANNNRPPSSPAFTPSSSGGGGGGSQPDLPTEAERYQAALSLISNQEDDINKAYDSRLKSLEEIQKAQEAITEQQRDQLDLSEALTRGDVAAAAKAMQQMRANEAKRAQESQRLALEAAREKELSGVTYGGQTRAWYEARLRAIEAAENARVAAGQPRANGGYISGPGNGTSDSIPAMLSNGEYVIRAAAVRALGVDRLNMLNMADKFARGGFAGRRSDLVRARAASRFDVASLSAPAYGVNAGMGAVSVPAGVGASSAPTKTSNSVYNYSVNVNAATNANPDQIAAVVVKQIQDHESRRIRRNYVSG